MDHAPPPGPARRLAIYRDGVAGRRPRVPVRFDDLAARAREKLPPEA